MTLLLAMKLGLTIEGPSRREGTISFHANPLYRACQKAFNAWRT